MNNQSTIIETLDFLNNECSELKNHLYKLTSNLDIDTFSRIYGYYRNDIKKFYRKLQKLSEWKLVDSVTNKNFLITFYEGKNKKNLHIIVYSLNDDRMLEEIFELSINGELEKSFSFENYLIVAVKNE